MIAGVHNFTIDQGATWTRTVELQNPDETPYNLTGYTARMQIRREITSTTVIMSLTTENGRIALGGALGTITLTLTDELTATIPYDGVYDLEIVSNGGEVYRVIKGIIRLNPEVTR